VLSLASNGLTAAEIAEQIGVSATTVKTHFDNIYGRLGVSDRCAAVATALRHGLIDEQSGVHDPGMSPGAWAVVCVWRQVGPYSRQGG
jgi:hypothetical protein